MPTKFADPSDHVIPVDIVSQDRLNAYLKAAGDEARNWLSANDFEAKLGQKVLIANTDGTLSRVVAGWGDPKSRKRGRLFMAAIAKSLPEGVYHFASGLTDSETAEAALAWLLAGYSFDRYKQKQSPKAQLQAPAEIDVSRLEAIAAGDFLTRDLINTPASDLGPDGLENAFTALANSHGAKSNCIRGDALLQQNLPMIHAVGRASDQEPRLLDMNWGEAENHTVTLVGKGVCFDTGGLNIKPGSSMRLMKKDMGGAATVLGLAHMIMALNLPVRLRVLVPAVENSISAGAYRPQDILTSRKGLTVEINNTDAEGRLVLADTLALADEESPDLLICNATLTGAARVAMGPDVSPFFTNDDRLARDISTSADRVSDPVWRMPFWNPYESMIEPDVADLDNAPKGGLGGAITAALFLRRFVENTNSFVHFDLYGWTPVAKPGRTLGGACQSARTMLGVIEKRCAN